MHHASVAFVAVALQLLSKLIGFIGLLNRIECCIETTCACSPLYLYMLDGRQPLYVWCIRVPCYTLCDFVVSNVLAFQDTTQANALKWMPQYFCCLI